ncbi:MAG: carbohydrate-binding domain-containing protein [Erysipelotrichaceae bacterium]
MIKKSLIICLFISLLLTFCGCNKQQPPVEPGVNNDKEFELPPSNSSQEVDTTLIQGVFANTSMFTDRDLDNSVDTSQASLCTLTSNKDLSITEEGIYLISGNVSNSTIYVEVKDNEKVQLVLDNVTIKNDNSPCIYVKNADKVFITTISDSTLSVSNQFITGENNSNAVIYSLDDLTLNGTACLTITSSENAVKCNDDLKITSGTYNISAQKKGFDANDSIRIANGTFTVEAKTDAFHAENNDDGTLGYIYIADGIFNIKATDDGIHATSVIQIDSGTFTINAYEGIEATYIQINGGTFNITASDDGINAARKSTSYSPLIEITAGDITIVMGPGDTDAIDSNGNLVVIGGRIDITANSAFDYDGNATYSSATIIVNGQQVDAITGNNMNKGNQPAKGSKPGR